MTTALSCTVARPPCAFGETGLGWLGPHHCLQCMLEVVRACQAFDAAVARGEFDAEGYTPKERRVQAKRRAA